jgi:DNA polymerase-3 subunit gamma/tau
MENFIVSARKYRPTTFNQVVGQSPITTTLKNAIRARHLAHAFLFCGPRGVGKTTCARILAKAINCQQLTADIEPCNSCISCKSFNERTSFNIYELDAASNNSVEDIRSLVDQVRYPPTSGLYKIYIIDEVHMLSQAAFNAFLKTLEEPPSYAIFILATTEKHKVLPTILSRCQIFDFQPIKPEEVVQHLKSIAEAEHIPYDEEALHIISQKSEGALRDALSMLDVIVSFGAGKLKYEATLETLHILDYSYYFRLIDALLASNIQGCLLLYEEIVRSGFDGFYFLEGLMGHLRNLLVAQDPVTLPLLAVPPSVQEQYHLQAQQAGAGFLLSALQQVNQCAIQYKESINKRFHVELALVALAKSGGFFQVSSIIPEAPLPVAPVNKLTTSVTKLNKQNNLPQQPASKKNAFPKASADLQAEPKEPAEILTPPAAPTNKISLQPTIKVPQVAYLKANIHAIQPTEHSEEPIEAVGVETTSAATTLTLEMALPHWQAYAQQLKAAGKLPAYNLMNQAIEVNDYAILLKFTNTVEEHILAEIREDLVNYLRKQLANSLVDVQGILTTQEAKATKPYTAQEKFRYLAAKYPQLLVLKERLGLEVVD